MKKTFKRFLAFAMVAVMMANPMSALAAETTTEETTSPAKGSADASGDVEGFVDTTIFKVVLPTSAEGTFDFIMDPQGLIAATSGDAYTGATFGDGTVFFNTASANASGDYKNTSNYIQVLNRGTVDVNVSVEATIDGLSDIAMASSDAFTSGDAAVPELYLAFTASGDASGDAKDANVALTKDGATIKAVLAAADQDKYEFNYASGNYTFDLREEYASGEADVFDNYSFALTGACNPYADWTDVKGATPVVKVVWTLTDADSEPEDITVTKTAGSTASKTFAVAGTVSSIVSVKYNGVANAITLTSKHYSVSGTNVTFNSTIMGAITADSEFTITFTDGTTQKLIVDVQ